MAADRQTAVGAFVLGGLALALGTVVFFGRFRILNPTIRAAIVFQDSISGLSVGAPVTFRGVRVGAVNGIALVFEPGTGRAFIPVTVDLQPGSVRISGAARQMELPSAIQHGLRAELNTQSFVTGQSAIDLDFAPDVPAVLHPEVTNLPEIPTRQSTFQRVREQLSQLPLRELADDASATLQSIRALSEKLNTSLPPLVEKLQTTSDHSTQAIDTAAQAIHDLQGRLDVTLENANRLLATSDKQLTQRGADLHTLLVAANQSVGAAQGVLANLRDVSSDRAATRQNIDATLRDLAAAAASLRGFASDVEHNPQLLLTGRRP